MSSQQCRWGILGTAGIARKNWRAIRLSGNSRVVAVASRSAEAANRFIDECSAEVPYPQRPEAIASYEALLNRDDIDAVYIPLPTAVRKEWVIRAAKAGKHVLGEKPAALNATEVEEMLAVCESNRVQYMDGVMFMHSQRMAAIREALDDAQQVGQIKRLTSGFSFCGDDGFRQSNIRTHSELEPYGCLGDLGWYCARFFLWAMHGKMPQRVRANMLTPLQGTGSPKPVPGEFSAELFFGNGVSASFYCSFITNHQQWVHVSGSKGYLRVDDFVLPYHNSELAAYVGQDHFLIENCTFNMEHHLRRIAVSEYGSGHARAQEVRMIQRFSDIVLTGQTDPQWPKWTLDTQRILDACFQSAANDGREVLL